MVLLAAATIVWNAAATYSRLGNLEDAISGKDGVKDQINALSGSITKINERIAKVETKVDAIDQYVLKQLKARAAKLLGTPNVQVAYVGPKSNVSFSVPYQSPPVAASGSKDEKEFFLTYTIEGIKDNTLIMRVQLEEEIHGKVVRSVYDRRVQIRLPTAVGERVTYDFKLKGDGISTPPVRLELVVLERVSPDNLILATAIKPPSTP